jgi:hypothetical protein
MLVTVQVQVIMVGVNTYRQHMKNIRKNRMTIPASTQRPQWDQLLRVQ